MNWYAFVINLRKSLYLPRAYPSLNLRIDVDQQHHQAHVNLPGLRYDDIDHTGDIFIFVTDLYLVDWKKSRWPLAATNVEDASDGHDEDYEGWYKALSCREIAAQLQGEIQSFDTGSGYT